LHLTRKIYEFWESVRFGVDGVPPKKPTLSQLEKRVMRRGGGEAGTELREKIVASVIPPPMDEVLEFIKTQSYLTPYLIAEKFGIRISIAKKVLSELAEKKYVRLVCGDKRMKIYEPIKESLKEVKPKKAKKREPGIQCFHNHYPHSRLHTSQSLVISSKFSDLSGLSRRACRSKDQYYRSTRRPVKDIARLDLLHRLLSPSIQLYLKVYRIIPEGYRSPDREHRQKLSNR